MRIIGLMKQEQEDIGISFKVDSYLFFANRRNWLKREPTLNSALNHLSMVMTVNLHTNETTIVR